MYVQTDTANGTPRSARPIMEHPSSISGVTFKGNKYLFLIFTHVICFPGKLVQQPKSTTTIARGESINQIRCFTFLRHRRHYLFPFWHVFAASHRNKCCCCCCAVKVGFTGRGHIQHTLPQYSLFPTTATTTTTTTATNLLTNISFGAFWFVVNKAFSVFLSSFPVQSVAGFCLQREHTLDGRRS